MSRMKMAIVLFSSGLIFGLALSAVATRPTGAALLSTTGTIEKHGKVLKVGRQFEMHILGTALPTVAKMDVHLVYKKYQFSIDDDPVTTKNQDAIKFHATPTSDMGGPTSPSKTEPEAKKKPTRPEELTVTITNVGGTVSVPVVTE